MLARANRVLTGEDFRVTVRSGRRFVTPFAVYHFFERSSVSQVRFGFIVSRAVGDAVRRNRVRRRLRAICRQFVDAGASGVDVVIRVLPPAAGAEWPELRADVRSALEGRIPVPA